MRVSDEDLSEAIAWRAKRDYRKDEGLDLLAMLDLRDARARVAELEGIVDIAVQHQIRDQDARKAAEMELKAVRMQLAACREALAWAKRRLVPWIHGSTCVPGKCVCGWDQFSALAATAPSLRALDGKGE